MKPAGMWLPKLVYESIPLCYLAVGALLLGAAFEVDSWLWPEIFAMSGLLALVIALTLVLRRRGYRSSRSRLDLDSSSQTS
jgi:hypothetical protein